MNNKNLYSDKLFLENELKELENLYLEKRDELFNIREKIKNIEIDNHDYINYKNTQKKQFFKAFIEILGIFTFIAITPNLLFNLEAHILKNLYTVLAISCISIESIVFFAVKSDINDYVKGKDKNNYNGKNTLYLEENEKIVEEHLKEIELQIYNYKDRIYNDSLSDIIPKNNVIDENNIKVKRKILEKK